MLLSTCKRIKLSLFVLAFLSFSCNVIAADYPSKPIKLVVNFAAGGAVDLTARLINSVATEYLGQPLIIQLKPGAGGAVGAQYASKLKPDGYNLFLSSIASMTVFPIEGGGTPNVNYKREDFEPIAWINYDPMIVVSDPKLGFKNLKDMIDYAKNNPEKLTFSSSGIWGAIHIPMEMLCRQAGIKMTHLPTTGGGPAMNAQLTGDAQISAPVASVGLNYVKEGTLTALAVTSAKRYSKLPNVPTLKELGFDIEFNHWIALFAPKGIPADVKKFLEDAFKKISEDKSYRRLSDRMGTTVNYMPGEEFQKIWDREYENFNKLILKK